MKTLPLSVERQDCWNRIGVWGDRSCPELAAVVHCHNCPIFRAAGRRFLERSSPEDYLKAWTARLAEKEEEEPADVQGVLIFRLGDEWLALPVAVLHEVISVRSIHRIPFQGGLLAGVVNVRGELHLSIRMHHLLGLNHRGEENGSHSPSPGPKAIPRLLVAGQGAETWVFRVDEVDRVHRLAAADVRPVPPTLGRAATRFTRGLFSSQDRAVGLLDEKRLFEVLRTRVR
ncbi:MAG TPA: chemotaxis protein CheW [Gemmataceae bacterium]|nr:chemotaxis protein CheW [Gemmataceae bacterium]